MSMTPRPGAEPLPGKSTGLRQMLYRGNLWVATLAVCLIGLLIIPLGVLNLRAYASSNLSLIARSMAYTVEAAVVFSDVQAAEEILQHIGMTEDVTQATVFDNHGQEFANWQRTSPGLLDEMEHIVPDWVLVPPVRQPLMYQDRTIGEIRVQGLNQTLLQFLVIGILGIIGCLALTVTAASMFARRLVGRIVKPLDQFAEVAHAVRTNRAFSQRMPDSRIHELHALGSDFNALLDELESWHKRNENEKASLAHQAFHDSLTGLQNRAVFADRLGEAIEQARDTGGEVAVLFIDGDQFKSINDERGHAAGDAVLIAIAERIRAHVRKGDVVVRLGGDEFAVMLTQLAGSARALQLADAILESMQTPIRLPDGGDVTTSLSIGIAVYPGHGETSQDLLRAADEAMYHAKRQGRGTRRLAQVEAVVPHQERTAIN